jgi:hypothetical protein
MDAKFFRRARKVNRAVDYTDSEAVIPAVKDSPEIRVPLPNRRPLTFEEREAANQEREAALETLEESIIIERKQLLELTKTYSTLHSGAADVVAQNLKVKGLMEKRAALAHPQKWIEGISGLSMQDIFEGKRDKRKLASNSDKKKVLLYQIKRRVEPIESLYIDLGAAADKASIAAPVAAPVAAPIASIAAPLTSTLADTASSVVNAATSALTDVAEAARGAIIGQRRTIKLKKTVPTVAAPAPKPT